MKNRIKKLYKGMSIKHKWSLFVIILVLYPMILIGYVGYANYEQVITRHFVEAVQKDILVVATRLQEEMQDIEQFATGIQQDEAVYSFTNHFYNLLKENNIDRKHLDDPDEWERYDRVVKGDFYLKQVVSGYLKSLILARQDITFAAYQFPNCEEFGYFESKDMAVNYQDLTSFRRNEVFQNMAIVLEDKSIGYYVDEESNIYIGKKIFYRITGEHCGTAVFKVDTAYLLRKYAELLTGANEAVFVVANNGIEVLNEGNLTEERRNKLLDFIESEPQTGIIYREESKKQAVVYNTFNEYNMLVGSAVYISRDILLADIRAMSRFVFLLCMSILPIFLLLANKLYKEVIYPVYMLSDKMQMIEKGELGVEVKSKRTDEFGYVFSAFNRMSKQLEYLVNCVYKEQIALKNAELKSLRAQINPHFLYNTLEMINWRARMSGEDDISEMIEALSGIMEINIDRRDSHFLTLDEELEYIKNYIFLIQKRFGDRVQFDFEVDEPVLKYKIPKLILQPLVENALSHGIEPKGKGCIRIVIIEKASCLKIVIADDGEGISEEKLGAIREQLKAPEKNQLDGLDDSRGHIGVMNVHKRIRLLYGEHYGLEIQSIEGKGTLIEIRLPKTLTGETKG